MLPSFRSSRHLSNTLLRPGSLQSSVRGASGQQASNFLIRKSASPLLQLYPAQTSRYTTLRRPTWRAPLPRTCRGARHTSKDSRPVQEHNSQQQKKPGRLAELARKYGWAAFGVYMALSALDFPFCYLAVRWLGTERIAEAEHFIVDNFWKVVGVVLPNVRQQREAAAATVGEPEGAVSAAEKDSTKARAHRDHEGASLWTQLILAYGVHKSLIFFRVPLTAAVLPKVVKFLRARGWNIGRPSTQLASNAK